MDRDPLTHAHSCGCRPPVVDLSPVFHRLETLQRVFTAGLAVVLRAVFTEGKDMTDAINDLNAAVTAETEVVGEVATAVQALAGDLARLEADFAALQQTVQNGDSAAIEAAVSQLGTNLASLRQSAQAAVDATSSIDAADPQPAPPADGGEATPAEPAPADGGEVPAQPAE